MARGTKKPKKPSTAHKRTEANVRVLRAMLKANPVCTHALLAEALAIGVSTLDKHYGDIIPHNGPGRPEHVPTPASRTMVEQHKALGLKHAEIAMLLDIEKSTLEKHYAPELAVAKARTVGLVGSQIVARALSKDHKDAQRAAEFFMERMGGASWRPASRLGVGLDPNPEDLADPLVGPAALGRPDARKVALLLYMAQRTEVVGDEPAPDEEPGHAV